MFPTKLRSEGRLRRDRLAAVDREDQDVGRRLELLALVEVLGLLVAGEVDHPVAQGRGPSSRSRRGPRCRARRRRAGPCRSPAAPWRWPVGPMATTGSPGFRTEHRRVEPPISRAIIERSPRPASTQAPVSAQGSISRGDASRSRGAGLQVLEAEELAGLEVARGGRRAYDDLDDGGGQAVHRDDPGGQIVLQPAAEGVPLGVRRGCASPRRRARRRSARYPFRAEAIALTTLPL